MPIADERLADFAVASAATRLERQWAIHSHRYPTRKTTFSTTKFFFQMSKVTYRRFSENTSSPPMSPNAAKTFLETYNTLKSNQSSKQRRIKNIKEKVVTLSIDTMLHPDLNSPLTSPPASPTTNNVEIFDKQADNPPQTTKVPSRLSSLGALSTLNRPKGPRNQLPNPRPVTK
jgi:hypothetical protein